MILAAFRDGEGTRTRIQAEVAASPGINVRQLCQRLDLAWSTVAYHLGVLRHRQAIHMAKEGRDLHLFSGDVPQGVRAALRVLRDDDCERVLAAILRTPNQGVYGLSAQLGLSHKVVRKHLGRLRDAGLVEKLGEYRPRYRSTEEAHRFLDAGLDRPDDLHLGRFGR
ncbi:MAG TPA: ArsR family transcriptional regulator [Candidatus Thermoplasmatota archaeon]|nr:ArsR family transcriptional regulator [Candidatus Thermoplasmatota archaeon]